MEEIDEGRRTQIAAAEAYINSRYNHLPSTIKYIYEQTYNYLMMRLTRFV